MKYTPGPASVFQQKTPFNEHDYLEKAKFFLKSSPTSASKMALAIIGFRPTSWQAWALLFKAGKGIQGDKKTFQFVDWLISKVKKISNLKDAALALQHHPTNIFLWERVCDIAINGMERDLEEIVRRIIIECNPDYKNFSKLAEFLCQKGKDLARGEKQTQCFVESAALIAIALQKNPNDGELHRMQINILATATTQVGGWEEVHRTGGTYRDVLSTLCQPSVRTERP